VDVLLWPALADVGVDAVVTGRWGGVSQGPYAELNLGFHVGDDPVAVAENRRRALATLRSTPDQAVFCVQSHGSAVHRATPADRGRGAWGVADAVQDADALVTSVPGLVLAVMVADCVPLAVVDPVAGVLGVVHAGWRGTVARIGEATVAALRGMGARPERMVAAIGPAVAPTRYQVGPEVAAAAAACWRTGITELTSSPDPVLTPVADGRWLFDLWTANRRILAESGVPDGAIHVAEVPTGGDGPFFSDRDQRPCGRFALLARLGRISADRGWAP
jgi:YfiH family protein